jgi:hypothetical protein
MRLSLQMPTTQLLLLVVAVVLMLGGAVLMLANLISPGMAIPLITVGIALSLVAHRRRQHIPSH